MRTLLATSLVVMLPASGWAQPASPAKMSITSTTVPEVLQVLDSSNTWVPIGTVDPVTHVFTPVGGVTPPPVGNCNQLVFSVACNSQYAGNVLP